MNINEVQKEVGLTKANINYYESEGLLASPKKNTETGKEEYTSEDIAALQKIKILRTAGVPLTEIKSLILSNKKMIDAINETENVLNDQIVILEEKKALCDNLRSRGESFHEIDLTAYDLEAQLPHTDLKAIHQTDKIFRPKFIDLLVSLLAFVLALVLLILPAYTALAETNLVFPWWATAICALAEAVCIVVLFLGNKKRKK